MERPIVGYHRDVEGDWVAELGCGHGQHVRHQPPFRLRPWVLDADGRASRLGAPLDCPLCDRAELPEGLRHVRTTPEWDEHTVPPALRRAHRVSAGTWGRIAVHEGRLRFLADTAPVIDVVVGAGSVQAIPPGVEHEVRPVGPVRFSIDFLAVPRGAVTAGEEAGEGGETACWAHLLCPECGVVLDGGPHLGSCGSPPRRW